MHRSHLLSCYQNGLRNRFSDNHEIAVVEHALVSKSTVSLLEGLTSEKSVSQKHTLAAEAKECSKHELYAVELVLLFNPSPERY